MSARARALGLCVGLLLLGEVGLRVTGRGPWRPFEDLSDLPPMSQPDPELGWTNLPGDHQHPTPSGPVSVHIRNDGGRGRVSDVGERVVLLGGSYVFGFGLPEDAVVSAQLQDRRPDLSVENHAVPGYGTVQSLLTAERLASTGGLTNTTVIYGFVELHEGRNVAVPSWLHGLERSSRTQSWARVPSASWDGSQLRFHAPRGYTHWPMSERIALVDAIERAWVGLRDRLYRNKAETTARLMARLRDQIEERGGRFVVALLDVPTRQPFYTRRLEELDVPRVELEVQDRLADGHPGPATHAAWASRLAEAL